MSWLSKGLKKAEHWIASKIPHTTAAEKRQAMQAAKEQIDYYQAAKEDLVKARADTEEQKKTERNKIGEQEIRARNRTYKRAGFMQEPASTPQDKLG